MSGILHEPHETYRIRNHMNRLKDPRSMGIKKLIDDVYPSLSKKLFSNKSLLARVVMEGSNPMDLLDYFVCRSCEGLCLGKDGVFLSDGWHPQCKCENPGCGATTTDPVTMREWLTEEFKAKKLHHLVPQLDVVVHYTAARMMDMAMAKLQMAIEKRYQQEGHRIGAPTGLLDANGNEILNEPNRFRVTEAEGRAELEEDLADPNAEIEIVEVKKDAV